MGALVVAMAFGRTKNNGWSSSNGRAGGDLGGAGAATGMPPGMGAGDSFPSSTINDCRYLMHGGTDGQFTLGFPFQCRPLAQHAVGCINCPEKDR